MKRQDVIKPRAPDDVDKLLFTHVRPILMEMAKEQLRNNYIYRPHTCDKPAH